MRLIVVLLLAATPLVAAPKRNSTSPRTVPLTHRVVSGKVTKIDGNRVEVKPWNTELPKRMWIMIGPETRLLLQQKTGLDSAKPGDLVTVLGTDTPTPPRLPNPADAAKPKIPEPVSPPKPPRASAIFRYPSTDASTEERKLFYRSARGFFIGSRRGGVDRPKKGAPIVPGILVSTQPLVVVRDKQGEHPFQPRHSLFVVEHVPTQLARLDTGETITVRCRIGDVTPQGDLVAQLVVVGPDPLLGKNSQRKLILREQRPLHSENSAGAPTDPDSDPDQDEEDDGDL